MCILECVFYIKERIAEFIFGPDEFESITYITKDKELYESVGTDRES